MAYPPVIPPATRSNATPQVDTHPADHNALATALNNVAWGAVVRPVVVASPQTGIGATLVDLTGFTLTMNAVAGRWYRASWLFATIYTVQGQQTFYLSLDGAQTIVAVITPPPNNYSIIAGSIVFSCPSAIGPNPFVAAGSRVIKLRGQTSTGAMSIPSDSICTGRLWVEDVGSTVNAP